MLAVMKVLAALLLVCAACGGDDIELYPVSPGGGGPTSGTSRPDASEGDGDGGIDISGRVCVIVDARTPTTGCADTGFAGLTVSLGNGTAMTMANGDFTIRVISGSDNVWRVTGTGIVRSAMTFASSNTIPALTPAVYQSMISDSLATAPTGTGAIIAKLTTNNSPSVGATATTLPAASRVFYDGVNATTWQQDATQTLGVVWAPDIAPTDTASMTVTHSAMSKTFTNIPVIADTITWLVADVP
jgi:hypothetical protein